MAEASGLYVLLAGLGAAWITAYYSFRTAQEAAKRAASAEDEKYRRERMKEHDQLHIEPLRQEIDSLLAFMEAVTNYYVVASSTAFDEDAKLASKLDLLKASNAAYRYEGITKLLSELYGWDGDNSVVFERVRRTTENVIRQKRYELGDILAPSQAQLSQARLVEPKQAATELKTDSGPLVKGAEWLEEKFRKWLP